MEKQEAYILHNKTIFPYSGEFDFNNKMRINKKHMNTHYLALDIAKSIHGENYAIAKGEQNLIYRKLDHRKNSLLSQMKELLGIDLKKFIKEGDFQQKADALKLLKLLYHFIKQEDSGSRGISLFENPAMDNVECFYCGDPFYTEIQEIKKILDYLNKERYGRSFQEISAMGFSEFAANEAVCRNMVLCRLWNNQIDIVKEINSKMEAVKNNEVEECKFLKSEKIGSVDVIELFSSALERYYLKCVNKTLIETLEELKDFFDSTEYFTNDDDLVKNFLSQEFVFIPKSESKRNALQRLLEDSDTVKLITHKEEILEKWDAAILKCVQDEAEDVIQNYCDMYWETVWDDKLRTYEDPWKKNIWVSILQMLYICRKESVQYISDSLGDKIQERSLKEVFRKWNKKENLEGLKKLEADQTWHRRKAGFIIDIPIDVEEDENSGLNEKARNKGKEYLIGKLFPQLIYARNLLPKEAFDEYINFLKAFHDIQAKLCESIAHDDFKENSNRFFEWLCKKIDADCWYNISEKEELIDSVEDFERFYELFRKDFLLNVNDTYQHLTKEGLDEDDKIVNAVKEIFISEDIEMMYQGLKELLPERCKTEYIVLQKLILTNNAAVFAMLDKRCTEYKQDAFLFLKRIFERVSVDEYAVLKKILRKNKSASYDSLKTILTKKEFEESKLKNALLQYTTKEQRILNGCIQKINEFEFSVLNKLIQRK